MRPVSPTRIDPHSLLATWDPSRVVAPRPRAEIAPAAPAAPANAPSMASADDALRPRGAFAF
jgi:hypothetical protein